MENNQLAEQPMPQAEGCANCGNPAILENYPTKLCSDCREKFIKFPIPKWLWAFAAVLGALLLFSLFTFPKNIATGIALEKGKKAEKQHRYATAQKEFERVVERQPYYIEGQSHLMKAAFYNLDFSAFGKAYDKLGKKDIEDKELLNQLDELLGKADNYFPGDSLRQINAKYDSLKTTIPDDVLLKYVSAHNSDVYAKFIYASSLYDKTNYNECDSISEKILESDSIYIPALRLLASAEREAGNYNQSIKYCQKLLDINNEFAFALASEARTFLKMKKDEEALKMALKACDMDKKDAYSVATLALAYHYNNNIKKRDEIVDASKKDTSLAYYMTFVLDVINKKEKFRD